MDSSLAPGLETSPRLRELVRFRRRLVGRPLAVVGMALVAIFALVAVLAPIISPYSPSATHFTDLLRPPLSRGYLLGTDELGRDELTRIVWGSRVSLEASVLATLLAFLISETAPDVQARTSATRLIEQFLPVALFASALWLADNVLASRER